MAAACSGLGRYGCAVAISEGLEPAAHVCLGIFLCGAGPVLGLTDVGFMQHSLVADHYQHIAIIGVIGLASAGFYAWHVRTRGKSQWAPAVAVAAVATLAFLTWRQNGLYRDAITLYQATLEKIRRLGWCKTTWGCAWIKQANHKMRSSITGNRCGLSRTTPRPIANRDLPWYKLGRLPEAIEEYEASLELKSRLLRRHTIIWESYCTRMGRLQESIEQFQLALAIKERFARDPQQPGNTHWSRQVGIRRPSNNTSRPISLKPDYDMAYFNLGNTYKAMGQRRRGDGKLPACLGTCPISLGKPGTWRWPADREQLLNFNSMPAGHYKSMQNFAIAWNFDPRYYPPR